MSDIQEQLAPVLLTVYNRKNHLKEAIGKLLMCPEAGRTTLFVCSDAPLTEKDEQIVGEIRTYVMSITGFGEIIPIFHEKNLGLLKAYEKSLEVVFRRFDSFIFLEDDVMVSPDFLAYMNAGLNYYRDDSRIFCVSAFSFSCLADATRDRNNPGVYFTNRFCPWGFGMWKSKMFPSSSYSLSDVVQSMKDVGFVNRLKANGADLLPAFAVQLRRGKMLVLDYLNTFHMVRNDLFTVVPYQSKSFNTGHDGSGTRTVRNSRYLRVDTAFLDMPAPYVLKDFSITGIDLGISRDHFKNWRSHAKELLWRLGILGLIVILTDRLRGRTR